MADKTNAMQRLLQYVLSAPRSLVVTRNDVQSLAGFRDSHSDVKYWYLRFEELLAPALPRVVPSAELVESVSRAVSANGRLTVVVQERVTAHVSGVMAVGPKFRLVEHVNRELAALLRGGVTPCRTLFASQGDVVRMELNLQEFYSFWEADQFRCCREAPSPARLSSTTSLCLDSAARRVGTGLLEWVETAGGDVVFLDYRPLSREFLVGLEEMVSGFDSRCYRTLPGNLTGPGASKDHVTGRDVFVLDAPLFEYTKTALPTASGFVFSAGGVLAHLCVYAAEAGISCKISSGAVGDRADQR